jgi:hypothetical protein
MWVDWIEALHQHAPAALVGTDVALDEFGHGALIVVEEDEYRRDGDFRTSVPPLAPGHHSRSRSNGGSSARTSA